MLGGNGGDAAEKAMSFKCLQRLTALRALAKISLCRA